MQWQNETAARTDFATVPPLRSMWFKREDMFSKKGTTLLVKDGIRMAHVDTILDMLRKKKGKRDIEATFAVLLYSVVQRERTGGRGSHHRETKVGSMTG